MSLQEYPLSDLALARALERTEGASSAAFVETRSLLEPEAGSTWRDVAGTFAIFDGVDSPLTQTFGLGVLGPAGDEEMEALESFFRERGAAVCHEVSPLATPGVLDTLNRRGYRPLELSSVLVRPTGIPLAPGASSVQVRRVGAGEEDLWCRIAGEGWGSDSPELGEFVAGFGRITARTPGTHCFLAEVEGSPIGTATLILAGEVALLAGASTIPSGRRLGAQNVLLQARLDFAAARGVGLAMVVSLPGSASQRNAERQGFRVAYTRIKWRLEEGG